MAPDPGQDELKFDSEQPWTRMVREKAGAYGCFVLYRDLGTGRTMTEAYRQWRLRRKGESQPLLVAPPSTEGAAGYLSPPSCWKRWRKTYRWDERAEAYDAHRERQRRLAEEAAADDLRRLRLEQLRQLQEIHYKRILQLNTRIDATLAGELVRKEQRQNLEGGKSMVVEQDAVEVLQTLAKEARLLEDRYFGPAAVTRRPGAEDESGPQEVVGEFTWVADPEMANQVAELEKAAEVAMERLAEARKQKLEAE